MVEGVIEGDPFVLWIGPEKSHKSWTLTDLCVSVATGTPFLGRFAVHSPGSVCYVDSEYGPYEFARRFARICRGRGVEPEGVLDSFGYVYARNWVLTRDQDDPNKGIVVQLGKELAARSTQLIVIDPLRNFLADDENDAETIRDFFQALEVLRAMVGCPVVCAHHLNRAGTYAGSRALLGRADLIIEGSDETDPWYSAKGRTIRRKDPLQERFTITVEHEHDEDDTRARTVLRARFASENRSASDMSRLARDVLALLKSSPQPLSQKQIAKRLRCSNARASQALIELDTRVRKTAQGWEDYSIGASGSRVLFD